MRNCRKQTEIDEGEREGLTTDEKEELARLRRENKVLKQEKEVLRKATVFPHALDHQLDPVEPRVDAYLRIHQVGELRQDRDVGPELHYLEGDLIYLEL